jgi:caffeoyl-CoA O-methyltransferase
MTDNLLDYIGAVGVREHRVLIKCRTETAAMGQMSVMQISPEQGAFMAMLARVIGAKRCLEIGTFTGYSALAVALALPDDGHVDACDISEDFMARARAYWKAADVAQKITGHVGPAVATLDQFLKKGRAGTYDFAFIDADKVSYDAYYERALMLVRRGGLIAIDNVLWSGKVADTNDVSLDTAALRAINAKINGDERVDMALVPISDGVMLARKR